jgi:hypothetical protein
LFVFRLLEFDAQRIHQRKVIIIENKKKFPIILFLDPTKENRRPSVIKSKLAIIFAR